MPRHLQVEVTGPRYGQTRTVYVNKHDAAVWEQAVKFCHKHDVSLSTVVADALRWYLLRLTDEEN